MKCACVISKKIEKIEEDLNEWFANNPDANLKFVTHQSYGGMKGLKYYSYLFYD